MKTITGRFILLLIISGLIISGCTTRSKYERLLKHELASGIRNDSLFMGLYLGMPEKDFYTHCWELNQKGVIKQGPNNMTVEYIMKKELKFPASMNFYPNFVDSKISEMPVKFQYTGWAPWNKKLSADSLQLDVLKYIIGKYGDNFIKIDHPERGSAFVQVKGNRRITVFKKDDMSVWTIFTDLTVKDNSADTTKKSSEQKEPKGDLK